MKKQNNAIVVTSIISGVVLVIALIALFSFNRVTSGYGGDTVNVQGIASVDAMPDLITVYFNIETKGETTTEAKDANSEILNDLIDSLVLEGFERKEIITENFNIYENCEWADGSRECDGYKATHSVKVELSIDEQDLIGTVVDVGVDAGAGISYINFELTRESQNMYKAEAMKLAAKDATIKAEAVAEGFDKKVGKLVSVQVNEFGYYPWNVYSSRAGGVMEDAALAKEAVSNIQPGEKEVTATVSASFKLK